MLQFQDYLKADGVEESQIIAVNFEELDMKNCWIIKSYTPI